MSGSVNDLVRYRLARSEETLAEARLLAEGNHWNAAVNRLYYACFYAILALLAQKGLSSSKHTGIRSLFNIHFVKTGKLSKETASTYNGLLSADRRWAPQAVIDNREQLTDNGLK